MCNNDQCRNENCNCDPCTCTKDVCCGIDFTSVNEPKSVEIIEYE